MFVFTEKLKLSSFTFDVFVSDARFQFLLKKMFLSTKYRVLSSFSYWDDNIYVDNCVFTSLISFYL